MWKKDQKRSWQTAYLSYIIYDKWGSEPPTSSLVVSAEEMERGREHEYEST
jgi:hypothetical protein